MIHYLALLCALALSGVSAYYSIIGLATIFASAFWPVILMGGALEAGKLVTASWLYNNWNIAPRLLKTYLTISVLVLMFISSMGVFGFLSRAHIDQAVQLNTGTADQIKILSNKIDYEKLTIDDLDKQIAQIDAAVNKMTEKGQANSSLRAAEAQRKTRESLVKKKDEHVQNISMLTQERIKLDTNLKRAEAEVGPIRYIAELIYGAPNAAQLDQAVRIVIIIIVFVFDPLAVVLLIAANVGLKNRRKENFHVIHKHRVLHLGEDKYWYSDTE